MNAKLNTLLDHPNSTMVTTHDFEGELKELSRTFPSLKFGSGLKCIDIHRLHRQADKLSENKFQPNHAYLVEKYLGIGFCQEELNSNWEARPLRPTQLHYAASCAWTLVAIRQELEDKPKKKEEAKSERIVEESTNYLSSASSNIKMHSEGGQLFNVESEEEPEFDPSKAEFYREQMEKHERLFK
mmetsp:Transcript_10114/g.15444  ORF Transcript_10114/g.15444 Transcript_10114/m.15444 type:complete len:185 (+) Transcript_10114:1-555(+)